MLKNPEIDVVSICTPSGMHGEMAVEVARVCKPQKISAKCRTLVINIEVEDTVVATLEFENGAIGTLVGDNGIEQWSILDSYEGVPEVVEPTFSGISFDQTKLPATSRVIMV